MHNDNPLLSVKAIMACGHLSNAIYEDGDGTRRPACNLCRDTKFAESKTIMPIPEGRKAECMMGCGNRVPSVATLRSFNYRPTKVFDLFYDGCEDYV